jgi:hypothetical protein
LPRTAPQPPKLSAANVRRRFCRFREAHTGQASRFGAHLAPHASPPPRSGSW